MSNPPPPTGSQKPPPLPKKNLYERHIDPIVEYLSKSHRFCAFLAVVIGIIGALCLLKPIYLTAWIVLLPALVISLLAMAKNFPIWAVFFGLDAIGFTYAPFRARTTFGVVFYEVLMVAVTIILIVAFALGTLETPEQKKKRLADQAAAQKRYEQVKRDTAARDAQRAADEAEEAERQRARRAKWEADAPERERLRKEAATRARAWERDREARIEEDRQAFIKSGKRSQNSHWNKDATPKRSYTSPDAAWDVAIRQGSQEAVDFTPYQCSLCSLWHVGHAVSS